MPTRALPFTLHSRAPWGLLLIVPCIIAGYFGLRHEFPVDNWMTVSALVFLALYVLALLIRHLPGINYLRVTETGIEVAADLSVTRVRWEHVREFGAFKMQGRFEVLGDTLVGFAFDDAYPGKRPIRFPRARVDRFGGFDVRFPDTYGMRAKDLAAMLNELREEQLAKRVPPVT